MNFMLNLLFKHSNELAQEVHEIRKLLNKFIGVLPWNPDSEVLTLNDAGFWEVFFLE